MDKDQLKLTQELIRAWQRKPNFQPKWDLGEEERGFYYKFRHLGYDYMKDLHKKPETK